MPTNIERTWRVQVFTDRGTDYRIEFLRERVKDFGGGDVIATPCATVTRTLSQVKDKVIPGGARSIRTLGECVALIAELGHLLAAEDAAAAAKAAADAVAESEAEA